MSTEQDTCKFVSKLDERGREIARNELNELNEMDRELAVQTFQQWVLEQTWLNSPTGEMAFVARHIDFEFLLRFLRVRKFSQLEARKSIENYWTSKTLNPKWFKDVDPAEEGVLAFLKSGFMFAPRKYDKFGRRLLICLAGNVDSGLVKKYGVDTLYKAICCIMDWLATDEHVQVNGLASFYDHTNIDYMLLTRIWTPTVAKEYMQFYQKAVPMRYKAIAIYNESSVLDMLLTICRPFMTDKIQKRIKTYGKSLVKLHDEWGKESLTQEYLPDEYTGPCLGNKSESIDEMIKEMCEPKFRNYIKDLSSGQYGVDLKVRKQDTESEVASFRKLNID